MVDGKLVLRKKLLKARRELPDDERSLASKKICAQILELTEGQGLSPWYEIGAKNTVLLYSAADNEVDVGELFERYKGSCRCYFPRTYSKGTQSLMDFHHVAELSDLKQGSYGLKEPSAQAPLLDEARGICIVPGVGFDENGGRLGHGVGYYDSFLSSHPGFLRIGVCYECQLTDSIPMDEHDVPVQYIVTEGRVIKIDSAE